MRLLRRLSLSARASLIASCLVAAGSGCLKSPQSEVCRPTDLGRCVVEEVVIEGNKQVRDADIEAQIATAESSHLLLGAFQNVPVLSILDAASVEYERFDRFVFAQDLLRVERYYKSRGFYDARARAGRAMRRSDGRVRVEIVVDEGRPVKIGRVDLEWKDGAPPASRAVTRPIRRAVNDLAIGDPFEEAEYEQAKTRVRRALSDRGYAYATVAGRTRVDLALHEAQIVLTVDPGPPCVVGDISIVGAGELPEGPMRSALGFTKGDVFSTSALESAQIALASFGVFGAVDVRPDLSPKDKPRSAAVPIIVEVQPAPLRAVKAGVGAELGSVVEAHLVGGWDDRNFFGGLRRLSVELRPGLVFYPWTINDIFKALPTNVLPQLKSRLELSQPLPFDTRTNARVRGEFNLYSPPRGEGDPATYILGYRTYTGSIGADRPFFNGKIRGDLFFNVELNDPFRYFESGDPPGFTDIIVPSIQTSASLDLRSDADGRPDPVSPNRGVYVSTDVQLAGYFLGGSADDVRLRPEVRGYVPISRRVTLALRWAGGFIVASNYPSRCADPAASAAWDDSCSPADVQLLGLRGFFSGGANSNRGYGYRGVGPHQKIESLYLIPGTFDTSTEAVPLGGLTSWEMSAELRFPIAGSLGGALFLDASDVSLKSGDLRFTRPHLTAGFGLRYATPVGPARLDVGYRVACAQVIGICDPEQIHLLHREEAVPGEFFGLPIAVSLAIGEAY